MAVHELRDLDEARLFLLQALWLQKVMAPAAARVQPVLEWALEVCAGGQPLPPLGFVADVGFLALGLDQEGRAGQAGRTIPGLSPGLARTYEDYVLGKFYADWTFQRAGDALRRYQGRDRARGLAFLLNQFCDRAGVGGVLLSPAVIKGLLELPSEQVLTQGGEALSTEGLHALLPELYESLVGAARGMAEILGAEDIFELERGTALAPLGDRVALRQVLQAAGRLEAFLPPYRPRSLAQRHEVPTRVLDEDTYPVGGFSSLSNRGSIESLLHSQLAYMEEAERPDLFDVKFLRDELLYYARDENQFLRRRRTFVMALFPDLSQTRFKDPGLPWQRGVLLLALLLVAVRKLSEWLSTDALLFEFFFLQEKEDDLLKPERSLLEVLLRDQIVSGTVKLVRASVHEAPQRCALAARRSLCHCVVISTMDRPFKVDGAMVTQLRLDGPWPALATAGENLVSPEVEQPLERWAILLEILLQENLG